MPQTVLIAQPSHATSCQRSLARRITHGLIACVLALCLAYLPFVPRVTDAQDTAGTLPLPNPVAGRPRALMPLSVSDAGLAVLLDSMWISLQRAFLPAAMAASVCLAAWLLAVRRVRAGVAGLRNRLRGRAEEAPAAQTDGHHKLSNALQMIASMISMQKRNANSHEAQGALHHLHDRVLALAAVHDGLRSYSDAHPRETGETVNAAEVLSYVASRILESAGTAGQTPALELDLDAIVLKQDRLVPMALFTAEILAAERMRLSDVQSGTVKIGLQMDAEARMAELSLRLPARPRLAEPSPHISDDTTGKNLIGAYAMQLRGTLTQQGRGEITLRFPVTDALAHTEAA